MKKDCLQGCGMVGASPEINKKKCNDTETATAWSSCQPLTGRKTRDDNCTERTAVARGGRWGGGRGATDRDRASDDGKQRPRATPAKKEPGTQRPFPHDPPGLPLSSWWGPTETQSTKKPGYSEHAGPLLGWRSQGSGVWFRMHRACPDAAQWSLQSGSSLPSRGISGVSEVIKIC